ncbi:hypothetical protein ACHAQD_010843 [Fusarium lateritium]
MAICSTCVTAISILYPKEGELEPVRTTSQTYDPYDLTNGDACWICAKHARFLEDYYFDVYQEWLQKPLKVVYICEHASMVKDPDLDDRNGQTEEPLPADSRGRRNLQVHQMFLWRNTKEERGGCEIELLFHKSDDIPKSKPYLRNQELTAINYQQIRDWLLECKMNHTTCSPCSNEAWFPTRLLDLGHGRATIKLIVTQEEEPTGPYMTLSHRWGPFPYEKLTTESVDRFKSSINLQSLPQVFQQAIEVVRELQIRYLWIDSLCIKQDKECGDWNVEALKMGQVYANSYLNLSASYSADAEETDPELFYPEPWAHVQPSRVELEGMGPLQRDIILDGDIWKDEVLDSPLLARGWVFQERFLAPRVLHFGMRQLAWECNGLSALEMFPCGLPDRLELLPKQRVYLSTLLPRQNTTLAEFRECWRQLVTQYSACELTFHIDKLIAFAGIAKIVEAQRGEEYIAGTWKSIIKEDLGWYRTAFRGRVTHDSETRLRAPSWSWLSLDGEIGFYPETSGYDSLTYFCSVLQTPERENVGSSVFTARGNLRVESLMLPIGSIEWSGDDIKYFHVAGFRFEQSDGPESTQVDFDDSRPEVENLCAQRKASFVPLYASESVFIGIIIFKPRGAGNYRRIGAAQIQFAKRPFKNQGPHLNGWILHDESGYVFHNVGVVLYHQICQQWKGGKHSVFSLN